MHTSILTMVRASAASLRSSPSDSSSSAPAPPGSTPTSASTGANTIARGRDASGDADAFEINADAFEITAGMSAGQGPPSATMLSPATGVHTTDEHGLLVSAGESAATAVVVELKPLDKASVLVSVVGAEVRSVNGRPHAVYV